MKKKGILKTKYENNYAFIDSQNLNLGVRSQGWILDIIKFRKFLNYKFKVNKAFIFLGYIDGNKKLYDALESAGYKIIFKPVVKTYVNEKPVVKGNIDAELVLEAVSLISKYDKAVIVSGDGDFHCLINYLKKKRKLERVVIPNKKGYSSLLKNFNKELFFIENNLNIAYEKV